MNTDARGLAMLSSLGTPRYQHCYRLPVDLTLQYTEPCSGPPFQCTQVDLVPVHQPASRCDSADNAACRAMDICRPLLFPTCGRWRIESE